MTEKDSKLAEKEYRLARKEELSAEAKGAVAEAREEYFDLEKQCQRFDWQKEIEDVGKEVARILYNRLVANRDAAHENWRRLIEAGGESVSEEEREYWDGERWYWRADKLRKDQLYISLLESLREVKESKGDNQTVAEEVAHYKERALVDSDVTSENRNIILLFLYDLGVLKPEEIGQLEYWELQQAAHPALLKEIDEKNRAVILGTAKDEAKERARKGLYGLRKAKTGTLPPPASEPIAPAATKPTEPEGKAGEIDVLRAAMDKAIASTAPIGAPPAEKPSASRHEQRLARREESRKKIGLALQDVKPANGHPKPLAGAFKESRAATDITLGLVEPYSETHPLHAGTEAAGHERFTEAARRLWTEFLTVHGKTGKERGKRGVTVVKTEADIDGHTALGLLKLAGIDTSQARYVLPGAAEAGRINIDTSNNDGIGKANLPTGEEYFFIDHHGSKSDAQTSAAKHIFRAFMDLGLLPPKEWRPQDGESSEAKAEKEKKIVALRELVDFVTIVDNLGYPEQGKLFSQSDRTLVGLRHDSAMTFDKMLEIISAGKKPLDILTDEELGRFGLTEASEYQKKTIQKAQEYLGFLRDNKRVFESPTYGKVVVDINGRLPDGPDAAASLEGVGALVRWYDEMQSFIIYTLNQKRLHSGFNLKQGKRVREGMWIKPRRGEKLRLSIGEVLSKMGCKPPKGDALKQLFDVKKYWEKYQRAAAKAVAEEISQEEVVAEDEEPHAPPGDEGAGDAEADAPRPPPPPPDDSDVEMPMVEASATPVLAAEAMTPEPVDEVKPEEVAKGEPPANLPVEKTPPSLYVEAPLARTEPDLKPVAPAVPRPEAPPAPEATDIRPVEPAPELPDLEKEAFLGERLLELRDFIKQQIERGFFAEDLSPEKSGIDMSRLVVGQINRVKKALKGLAPALYSRLARLVEEGQVSGEDLDRQIVVELLSDPLYEGRAKELLLRKMDEFAPRDSAKYSEFTKFAGSRGFIGGFIEFCKKDPPFFQAVKFLKTAGWTPDRIVEAEYERNKREMLVAEEVAEELDNPPVEPARPVAPQPAAAGPRPVSFPRISPYGGPRRMVNLLPKKRGFLNKLLGGR